MSPGTNRDCGVTEKQTSSLRQAAHSLLDISRFTHIAVGVDGLQQPVPDLLRGRSRSRCHCLPGGGRAPGPADWGREEAPPSSPPPSLSFSLAGLAAGQLEPHVPPGSSAPPVRGRKAITTAREEQEENSLARLVLDPPGPPLCSSRLHRGDGGGGRAQLWAGASPAQCILGHARR